MIFINLINHINGQGNHKTADKKVKRDLYVLKKFRNNDQIKRVMQISFSPPIFNHRSKKLNQRITISEVEQLHDQQLYKTHGYERKQDARIAHNGVYRFP